MESEIVVRGAGRARAMPDRAVVRVEVDGDGSSREDAYAKAAPQAAQVDDVLAGHEAALDRVATAALMVHPRTRWRKGEAVRTGWRATRTSVVEVVDFTHLGDLMAELAGAGGAVSGPYWQLDPTNDVYGTARRRAAEDARRRADLYAAALGLRIGGVAWVAEPGLRGDQPRNVAVAGAALARGRDAAGDDDVIEVSPDEMTVEAEVEVGFAFTDSAVP
jgi:uncharacterized protein YggE